MAPRIVRIPDDRFTNVYGLNNLIWEFNPGTASALATWYPGNAYVDMISIDVYPGTSEGHPVYANEYNQLWNFTGGRKLVGSESIAVDGGQDGPR